MKDTYLALIFFISNVVDQVNWFSLSLSLSLSLF